MDAIGAFEQVGDLAIRHAAVLVEVIDGSGGIRADLAGGSADGIGSLLGMTTTHPPTTMAARPFVNAEFSANGLDGNLFLKLLIDLVILRDVAAAMGTAIGKGRFEDLVDLVVGRNGAMSMFAVRGAFGPGGGLGILLGLTLGEGCRLPLVGPLGLFELSLETIAFGLKTSVALLQISDSPIASRASRADRNVHNCQRSQTARPQLRSICSGVEISTWVTATQALALKSRPSMIRECK